MFFGRKNNKNQTNKSPNTTNNSNSSPNTTVNSFQQGNMNNNPNITQSGMNMPQPPNANISQQNPNQNLFGDSVIPPVGGTPNATPKTFDENQIKQKSAMFEPFRRESQDLIDKPDLKKGMAEEENNIPKEDYSYTDTDEDYSDYNFPDEEETKTDKDESLTEISDEKFVSIVTYKQTGRELNTIKKILSESNNELDDLKSQTEEENKKFEDIKSKIEDVERKIISIDQNLFNEE